MWFLGGVGLLLLIKSLVMSLLLFAWGCLDSTGWRGVASVVMMFLVNPVGALAFAGMQIWEADCTTPMEFGPDGPNSQVARVHPWYVRAVLGAMDSVVHGDVQ